MAVNEEARARRYEWRAGVLRFDPADDRKVREAALFEKAARLARRVGELRPAFDKATDQLSAAYYAELAAWHKGGRKGDKPTNNDAVWNHPDVLAFRGARADFSELFSTAEFRAAAQRCHINDWSEPSDEELLGGAA